jgi:hypothetical protein
MRGGGGSAAAAAALRSIRAICKTTMINMKRKREREGRRKWMDGMDGMEKRGEREAGGDAPFPPCTRPFFSSLSPPLALENKSSHGAFCCSAWDSLSLLPACQRERVNWRARQRELRAGGAAPTPGGFFLSSPLDRRSRSPPSPPLPSTQPPKGKKVAAVPAAAKKVRFEGCVCVLGACGAGVCRRGGRERCPPRRRFPLALSPCLSSLFHRRPPARPRRPTPCTRSGPRRSVSLMRGEARVDGGRPRGSRGRGLETNAGGRRG